MCNLGMFNTLVYLRSNILRTHGVLRNLSNKYMGTLFYRTVITLIYLELIAYSELCQNNYDGKFYSQLFVTPAYSESKPYSEYYQISITKHFFQNLVYLDIFRTLAYSEHWYILKSKHNQKLAEYLRWDNLLRTLCNYRRLRGPI